MTTYDISWIQNEVLRIKAQIEQLRHVLREVRQKRDRWGGRLRGEVLDG